MAKETKPKTKRKTSRADQMAVPEIPAFEIGREYRGDDPNKMIVIKAIESGTVTFEEKTCYINGPAKTQVFTMAGDSFKDFMKEVYNV